MSNLINEKSRNLLPRRTYFQILISFPLYLVKVIIGDLGNINSYIRLLFVFYKNYFSLSNFRMKYILAHKDLHSGNILIGKNEIIVIDPEICVLADEVTDIAHIARYYSNKFSDKEMKSILNFSLKTNRQKKNFISLSIYYSIQMMAIRNKNNASYVEAKNYLFKYFDRIKLTYL